MKDELKAFKESLYRKYGGQSNYLRAWLQSRGQRKIDYLNELAQHHGFKNQNDYLNSRYKLRGFDDRAHWQRHFRLLKRFPHLSFRDALRQTQRQG